MSEKRSVPTFRMYMNGQSECLEGPVVSPDKRAVAGNISQVHEMVQSHQAVLVYAGQWIYIPLHSIHHVECGKNLFSLPWPLTD